MYCIRQAIGRRPGFHSTESFMQISLAVTFILIIKYVTCDFDGIRENDSETVSKWRG